MSLLAHVMPKADEVTVQKRREICASCEFKRTLPVINRDVCGVCGCPILSKTELANSNCPKGKW